MKLHSSQRARRARPGGVLCLTLGMLFSALAWPQSLIPELPADGPVTAEQIEASIEAVAAEDGLDEVTRTQVINHLRDAQVHIQTRQAAEQAAATFVQSLEAAPAELAALQEQLAAAPPPRPAEVSQEDRPATNLAELEQLLAGEVATQTGAESRLAELDVLIGTQETRPELATLRASELRRVRDELDQQVRPQPPAGEDRLLSYARRLATTLHRDAVGAEINRFEQELASHAVRLKLLHAQRELAQRVLMAQRDRVAFIQAQVSHSRQEAAHAARQQAELTELAVADMHPVVRRLAETNAALTRGLPEIAAELNKATAALGAIEEQARQLEQQLARSRQRLEIAGVSAVIGQLFFEERRNLPKVPQFRAELRARRMALSGVGLALINIEEQRRGLSPLSARIEEAMTEVAADVSAPEELAQIDGEVRALLQSRRDLLEQAANTHGSYLRALGDLDIAQRRLLRAVDEYTEFLNRNLLWMPSSPVFNLQIISDIAPAVRWLLAPGSWGGTWSALLTSLRTYGLPAVAAVLLWALLIAALRPLASRFKAIERRVGRLATDHIGLTLAALLIAAVRALPLPLGLALSGIFLRESPSSTEFSGAVAVALLATAPFLYNVIFYRALCAPDGLGRTHFRWPPDRLPEIHQRLHRLAFIGAPWVFVTVLAFQAQAPAIQNSLGRVLFVGLMILFSITIAPLLFLQSTRSPTSPASVGPESVFRVRRVWFVIAAGGPLLLALLAILGYQHTAGMLIEHLVETFWLMLALVLTYLVALRWLSLTRRKIAWKLALQRRAEQKAKGEDEPGKEAESEIPVLENEPLDLDAVDLQTRRLLRGALGLATLLGAWGIWSEVLPALSILQDISLWSQSVTTDGEVSTIPVTVADLLLAFAIIIVTIVASRNLPGLMEIAVLQHLNLDNGSRYAATTLTRYFVVALGAILVFGIVGWNWSQIQWLVAALSVGLGFGLQEIVANFVSGLIILFERPVRVGDTVTVGEVTGTVSNMRIRATTIMDWDRKEIIIPNKSFITQSVVNWTLTDAITRIVVPVGIAYGSDVKLARQVMEDTLHALPLVLDDPAPRVYFSDFGDSSLNFKLQVYCRQLADRIPLTHALHEGLLAALRQNGIEIPFPQHDLHLRTIEDAKLGPGMRAP